MAHKKAKIAAIAAAGVLLLGGGAFLAGQRSRDTFLDRTYYQGMDLSGRTAEEAAEAIIRDRTGLKITLTENGKPSQIGTPSDYGYTLDQDAIRAELSAAQETQRSSVTAAVQSLYRDTQLELEETWTCDENVLYDMVKSRNLLQKRVPSRDAELVYNEEDGSCEIQPAVYGNQFAAQDMNAWIKPELDSLFSGRMKNGTSLISLAIPSAIYRQPAVKEDDPSLTQRLDAVNRYAGAKITYTFGSQEEELTFETFQDWMTYENGFVHLDDAKIADYVEKLAEKYDTRGVEKIFTTTYGESVHFNASQVEYGYRINQEEEVAQLKQDLKARKAVTREPVYYVANKWDDPWYYSRDGLDDLNGTYVEVSISDQHVWFYKNGKLIVEGDCVTGNHAKKMDTTHGVYPIAYKKSPAVLKGGEGKSHYETPVTYWMPFNGGQGLHDASWRGSFGGKIYKSHGSHGCVNLPKKVAKAIYENCSAGMAVVVY